MQWSQSFLSSGALKNKKQNNKKQIKHTRKGRINSLMAFYDTQGHNFKCYSFLESN